MTPLETVNFILAKYTVDILRNYKKIEAIFSDLCREEKYKQQSNTLLLAVKAGIPYILCSSGEPDEWLELKLVEKLSTEYGLKNELALSAVLAWSNAISNYQNVSKNNSQEHNNKPKNMSLLAKLISEGGSENHYLVGRAYLNGVLIKGNDTEEVGIDANKGYQYLILASQGRHADAQNYLGYCFEQGVGVSKNPSKAFEYYKKASKKGSLHAKYNLASCLEYGIGVEQDEFKALNIYQELSDDGYVDAKNKIAWYYENGHLVHKDLDKALELYKESADAGSSDAQCYLGEIYHFGVYGKEDVEKAKKWYLLASKNNNTKALQRLSLLV